MARAMHSATKLAVLIMLPLLLGACARGEGSYPSLERRPAERLSAVYAPPSAPSAEPPAPLDPAVLNRLDGLIGAARSADATFHGREAHALALVDAAAGAARASEAWSVATIAVSELESARAQAMIALADLDRLYVTARSQGQDVTAVAAARDQVTALVAAEDKALDSLKGRLGD